MQGCQGCQGDSAEIIYFGQADFPTILCNGVIIKNFGLLTKRSLQFLALYFGFGFAKIFFYSPNFPLPNCSGIINIQSTQPRNPRQQSAIEGGARGFLWTVS